MELKEIKRGDIFLCNLPITGGSSVQTGIRPCVVVSNEMNNTYSPNVVLCPITTKVKRGGKALPTHVKVTLKYESTIMTEQILTLSKEVLINKLGELEEEKLYEVDEALKISLNIFEAQEKSAMNMDIIRDIQEMIKSKRVTMSGITSVLRRLCKSFNIEEEMQIA